MFLVVWEQLEQWTAALERKLPTRSLMQKIQEESRKTLAGASFWLRDLPTGS
jgi:hypothetical protein